LNFLFYVAQLFMLARQLFDAFGRRCVPGKIQIDKPGPVPRRPTVFLCRQCIQPPFLQADVEKWMLGKDN
jgi:hypothetical protein